MPAGDPAGAGGAVVQLYDGSSMVLRAIRESDEALMVAFHGAVSAGSVYQRYFQAASLEQRIAQQRLATACRVDPAEGVAVVGERQHADGRRAILAVGRLRRSGDGQADLAVLVADVVQGQGLGTAITGELLRIARAHGLRSVNADLLAGNQAMHAVLRHFGFVVRPAPGDARVLRGELTL